MYKFIQSGLIALLVFIVEIILLKNLIVRCSKNVDFGYSKTIVLSVGMFLFTVPWILFYLKFQNIELFDNDFGPVLAVLGVCLFAFLFEIYRLRRYDIFLCWKCHIAIIILWAIITYVILVDLIMPRVLTYLGPRLFMLF